jgi:NADH-quinone oxidoreductase subunit L
MVAAGVYLVARCFPLFSVVSTPLQIVGYIGGITALFAAICALSESDLKRILAYSTISQLGYMFAGLYVAIFSPQIGLFHLMTHGVFKALLFLCAGCVIHKLHLQNIWALGGLWRNMPKVALAFAIGAAALAGLPFTSGYYSKELLLINAYYTDKIIFSILLLTAAFTAFYIARAFFLVFLGTPKHNVEVGSHHNKREIEWVMLIPVIILTLGAILVGYLPFLDFIGYSHTPHMNIIHPPTWVEILPTILSLMSIFLAFIIYRRLNFDKLRVMIRKIPGIVNIYKISAHKFFFDELYSIALVRSAKIIARTSDKFDTLVVDGGINSTAYIFSILGKLSRKLQLGFAQSYLFFAVISFSILLLIWLIYFLF